MCALEKGLGSKGEEGSIVQGNPVLFGNSHGTQVLNEAYSEFLLSSRRLQPGKSKVLVFLSV